MITISAGSTCYVTAAFKDKTGQALTPSAASWRAINLAGGEELQPVTELAPASSIEITVPETVNRIVGASPVAEQETRRIIVSAVYDGGAITGYYDYQIRNLEK